MESNQNKELVMAGEQLEVFEGHLEQGETDDQPTNETEENNFQEMIDEAVARGDLQEALVFSEGFNIPLTAEQLTSMGDQYVAQANYYRAKEAYELAGKELSQDQILQIIDALSTEVGYGRDQYVSLAIELAEMIGATDRIIAIGDRYMAAGDLYAAGGIYKKVQAKERLNDLGEVYANKGSTISALHYFMDADNQQRLDEEYQKVMTGGSLGDVRFATEITGRTLDETETEKIGTRLLAEGQLHDAREALLSIGKDLSVPDLFKLTDREAYKSLRALDKESEIREDKAISEIRSEILKQSTREELIAAADKIGEQDTIGLENKVWAYGEAAAFDRLNSLADRCLDRLAQGDDSVRRWRLLLNALNAYSTTNNAAGLARVVEQAVIYNEGIGYDYTTLDVAAKAAEGTGNADYMTEVAKRCSEYVNKGNDWGFMAKYQWYAFNLLAKAGNKMRLMELAHELLRVGSDRFVDHAEGAKLLAAQAYVASGQRDSSFEEALNEYAEKKIKRLAYSSAYEDRVKWGNQLISLWSATRNADGLLELARHYKQSRYHELTQKVYEAYVKVRQSK